MQLFKKYGDNKFECKEIKYIDSIKICKKKNLTKELCNISQLAIIPGISKNIATKIIDKYESIPNIIDILKEDKYGLAELVLNKKKLGKHLSETLHNYLL